MTPPSASAAGAAVARPARAPRRAPEPSRPRRVARPADRRRAQAPVGTAPSLARAARGLCDHPLLARLVSGRLWIGFVAFALIGIVAMQLALLKLNTGIGRAIAQQSTLQRENSALQADVSQLSAADRIEMRASALGMVASLPGETRFLSARAGARAGHAAAALAKPVSPATGSTSAAVLAPTGTIAPTGATAPTGTIAPTGATAPTGTAGGPSASTSTTTGQSATPPATSTPSTQPSSPATTSAPVTGG